MAGCVGVDWAKLENLAEIVESPKFEPNSLTVTQMGWIDQAVDLLGGDGCEAELIKLRKLFTALLSRDSLTNHETLIRLDEASTAAARRIGDLDSLGRFLGARGHNLHRQGYHEPAIAVFDEAERVFLEIGETFEALKSHYMTALCYRALGRYGEANCILDNVLQTVPLDNLWRGNPLQVKAWLLQDEGDLAAAEDMLRQAIALQRQMTNGEILVANSLGDLAEIVSLRGRIDEAIGIVDDALQILQQTPGQYRRQEAQALRKRGEIEIRAGCLLQAEESLRTAAELASGQYYDVLWRTELDRFWLFTRLGRPGPALAKLRSVQEIRRELGLSNWLLIQQLARHLRQRILGFLMR